MAIPFLKTNKQFVQEQEPVIALKSVNVFDYLNAINKKENYSLCERDDFDATYSQFIINRALSQFVETLPFAEILTRTSLTNQMHFDFLWYCIPKKKRFGQWVKPEPFTEDVKAIQRAYNVSFKKAMEYKLLLSENQINFIMMNYPEATINNVKSISQNNNMKGYHGKTNRDQT